MYGFSHQFPIVQENAMNPTCDFSGWFSRVLLFLLAPKSGDSFKEQSEKTDKVNSIFLKKKRVPDTLGFKAKSIKSRIEHGCSFIKKEEYKYIFGRSIPP